MKRISFIIIGLGAIVIVILGFWMIPSTRPSAGRNHTPHSDTVDVVALYYIPVELRIQQAGGLEKIKRIVNTGWGEKFVDSFNKKRVWTSDTLYYYPYRKLDTLYDSSNLKHIHPKLDSLGHIVMKDNLIYQYIPGRFVDVLPLSAK